ncbi:MAG: F0F1 ATP synthase subunit B [Patescibacteria group bacterium]
MEQLIDVFGIDWKLLIAQVVNFLILLGVLSYFLYRPVMKVLSERRDFIEKGVRDAEAASHQLTTASAEATTIVSGANKDADAIVARAKEEAAKERAAELRIAGERAEALVREAQMEADEAKRRALKDAEKEIAQSAVLAAERILRSK